MHSNLRLHCPGKPAVTRFAILKAILAIGIFLTTGRGYAQEKQETVKILLITGSAQPASGNYGDWHHDHYNQHLVTALEGIAKVTVTADLSILNDESLKEFSIIINNSLFKEPDEKQFAAFRRFIEGGKSYFAIHAGLVSFLNSETYAEVIGGKFINHDEIKTFTVNTHNAWYGWEAEDEGVKHTITRNVADFKTLDELYLVEFNDPGNEVIARAELHPVMWARRLKKGTVLCLTLGHGEFSQTNSGFQQLFYNGIRWLLAEQGKPGNMKLNEGK
jgi:type 1 glutamine amidotransferase